METANPFLFKSTVLHARDLTPVMGIDSMQMYIVAKPTIEAKDARQLIALAKANPGKMTTPPRARQRRRTSQAIKERFNGLGAEPVAVANPEFRKLLAEEGKTVSALIRDRKIVVE